MISHDDMLENVAVYALGALPPQEADTVRAHLAGCAQCQQEYRHLRPVVDAVALSAEACTDARSGAIAPPSPSLKGRIMATVRAEAAPQQRALEQPRAWVWPAYAFAAACLLVAALTTIAMFSLSTQVSRQHRLIAALTAPAAQRFTVAGGTVLRNGNALYMVMNKLPALPSGRVYQAWTLRIGESKVAPSVTFAPDARGVAIVALPVDAQTTAAVALSVEPAGGSEQPTTKPLFVVKLL